MEVNLSHQRYFQLLVANIIYDNLRVYDMLSICKKRRQGTFITKPRN